MKKRILAIVLVLMLAVSLLPAAAFAVDVPISLSVNGRYFSEYGQTINVGGGTATLGISQVGLYPMLTLKNVNINSFDRLEMGDGRIIYAGIVFSGATYLYISLEGNNTITAPANKADGTYVGIFCDSSTDIYNPPHDEGGVLSRASLTINNADIGILGLTPTETYYLVFSNLDIRINNAAEVGIQGGQIEFNGCSTSISSKGFGIVANSVTTDREYYWVGNSYYGQEYYRRCPMTVTVSSDTAPEIGGLVGIQSEGATFYDNCDIKVSYKCKGNEEVFCCGVNTAWVSVLHEDCALNTVINLQGNENSYAVGIMADNVKLHSDHMTGYGKINVDLNLGGKHGQSMGIFATDVTTEKRITSDISGADIYDIPVCADNLKLIDKGAVYAGTDCKDPMFGAVLLKNFEPDSNTVIHLAAGGVIEAEIDGEAVRYCADEEGRPAQYFAANDMSYAFFDIDESGTAPYRDAILWAVEKGITNGVSPVEFSPSAFCTRGQIVTFLWRAMGSPEPETADNPFVDVKASSYYYKPILWALENGITNGTDETHFSPEAVCTRAQAVTFLWRSEGRPEYEITANPFVDVSDKGECAPFYDAILWAYENGITNGTDATHFSPYDKCTRGQIVTFIYRDIHEKAMNDRGALVDVIIDVDPDEVFKKIYNPEISSLEEGYSGFDTYSSNNKGKLWDYVPVNFTYVFEDGSRDEITMYLKGLIVNGELSVSEDWVQLLTIRGTKVYLTYGLGMSDPSDKSGYLLVADAKKHSAEFFNNFSGSMKVYGDFIVAMEKGARQLQVYDMASGKYGTVMENVSYAAKAAATDYAVYGDYLLYWCNIASDGIRVGGMHMNDIGDGYARRFGDFYRCKSFTHDETGFTVIYQPDKNSSETAERFFAYP